MDTVFGDHKSGDELLISIDSNRSFQVMFSHLSRPEGIIMTRIPAGESGGVDSGDRDQTVVRIELFQGTFKEEIEADPFDPAEKFLKRGKVRDLQKTDFPSDSIHLFKIPDYHTIVFFPVFFEEKNGHKLVLGIISPRIFTGIQGEM
jgi:hypothetical protein